MTIPTKQISINDNYGYYLYGFDFEAIECLPDGSFVAQWFNNNAGGVDTRAHWVSFKPNGQIRPSFPPPPLSYVRMYLSVTNRLAGRRYEVEQSNDFVGWEKVPSSNFTTGPIDGIWVGPWEFRIEEAIKPQFFRVVEVPNF